MIRRLLIALLLAVGVAFASAPAGSGPGLPTFAGWEKTASTVQVKAPWGLAPALVPSLQEFGLDQVEHARYQRGDRTIQVEGLLFRDSSGAFGAFLELRPADALSFDAGSKDAQGESSGNEIWMQRGSWVIHVSLDTVTAMTASDMRQLLAALPMRGGSADVLPTLPDYLPAAHKVPNSTRYAEGPAEFSAACSWIPVAAVGFNQGAEAATASYAMAGGEPDADLAVLAYPTPQIARSRFEELGKVLASPQFQIRRTGPIVVVVKAQPGSPVAQQLLQSVNYDAEVTMTQPTPMGVEGLPGMILAIFLLIGMIVAVALVVGLISGVLPALLRRRFPNRFKGPDSDQDFIALHLK